MAPASVVRQPTDGSRYGTEQSQQTSRTSIETTSSGRIRDRPKGSVTLAESRLRSLPTWTPLSDWLSRDDDPFPYGKRRANPSSSGG
ncbi:hypothetical protein F5B21DRAFT_522160 [Xylaria acuta]|nr:hypothetical protein F5B21DRAFT_522160 [Xylaria acuta]